jgi:hypothetical protein
MLTEDDLVWTLAWIDEHSHLVDFNCPDATVPAILRELRERKLLRYDR